MNLRILTRYDWLHMLLIMIAIISIAFVSFVSGALVQYKSHVVEKHLYHDRH